MYVTLSTKDCTFNNGKFATDASIIAHRNNGELFCQVLQDSADEGLALVSHKSGLSVRMLVDEVCRRDGDVQYWRLVAYKEDLRRARAGVRDLELFVYNT